MNKDEIKAMLSFLLNKKFIRHSYSEAEGYKKVNMKLCLLEYKDSLILRILTEDDKIYKETYLIKDNIECFQLIINDCYVTFNGNITLEIEK